MASSGRPVLAHLSSTDVAWLRLLRSGVFEQQQVSFIALRHASMPAWLGRAADRTDPRLALGAMLPPFPQYENVVDVARVLLGVQAQMMPATLASVAVRIKK